MKKFYRGRIIKTQSGAVQFIRNNEKKKDFILLTGRYGDIYIPVSAIERALEDQWNADQELRNKRIAWASECTCKMAHVRDQCNCERCV